MKYILFIDDGHGMETAGKRTPLFTDGSFMHENEFNRAVTTLIMLFAQATKDVYPILTAPTDEDVSLAGRTNYANAVLLQMQQKYGTQNLKPVYVSIHANALKGTWGDWGGQEIFHYPDSVEGQKLANAIYSEMVKGTQLPTRGVKAHSFHMTKYPNMPSVITESAFMDNLTEAKLLLSWSFRLESAIEIFTGVCKYWGILPTIPEIFSTSQKTIIDNHQPTTKQVEELVFTLEQIRDQANLKLIKYSK